MSIIRRSVDKVRASRDGHEFHENWAARKALQLLWPQDDLIGIAIEGLHPADQKNAASETVEIADATMYYGKRPTFKGSDNIVIVQLKYSISDEHTPFRNSHAKKTIIKFAAAYKDHINIHGVKETNEKLEFELVTNRPIYPALEDAVQFIAEGKLLTGENKKQADQFIKACGLKGKELKDFAKRVSFSGLSGSLKANQRSLSKTLADWSGGRDPMSRAYLEGMKQLLRDKAGSEGERNNIIKLVDVLDRLEVDKEGLFPCPESFPEIGEIVKRDQLANAIKLIDKTIKPFLIHAAGGVGKTVFLQSIAEHYAKDHEVVLFDCFGGGAYRAPEDARHLPKRAFTHIVNRLAQKGLCDPLIPTHNNTEDLIKTFRSRLEQAANTLQRVSLDKKLLLFIDAIDNAAEFAQERNEDCFSKELLRSIEYNQSISNVTLVLSCRTERREIAKNDLTCEEYPLEPFSIKETKSYLKNRVKNLTSTEIEVAQARSAGNPRVLDHLALSDRGLLDKSEINKTIELDDLLKARIKDALNEALGRGYKKADINSFFAGLSVLPPPVPIDEYAIAQDMDVSAIESFVADLAPLLERTKHGIWFRDEPTETLIRNTYASDEQALKKVSENLYKQQGVSVYAARSLPGLLQKRGDGEKLFALAFDERFPKEITSTVGKQAIRHARLKAAVSYATHTENYNQIVRLSVEISTIEAGNKRGADYILDNPDLIIASQDTDATRRLFEIRTSWQGTRHARLAIAHILSGDSSEAHRHALTANEWISHFSRQDQKYKRGHGGQKRIDVAAIPLCILSQGKAKAAIGWMRQWKSWYAYEVSEYLFSFIYQSRLLSSSQTIGVEDLLNNLTDDIGVITGVLSFHECTNDTQKALIIKLAKACNETESIDTGSGFQHDSDYSIQEGLFKAGSIALSMGLKAEILSICGAIKIKTPSLWSFNDHYSTQYVIPFIIQQALTAGTGGSNLSGQDILPEELAKLWPTPDKNINDVEFEKLLKQKITERFEQSQKEDIKKDQERSFSYDKKNEFERFLSERFKPLTQLVSALAQLLSSPVGKAEIAFLDLVQAWSDTRKKKSMYEHGKFNRFFEELGRELLIFSLWTRNDLSISSITKFWEVLNEGSFIGSANLIQIISILSKQIRFHELAGEMSIKASTLIEKEDHVDTRVSLFSSLSRAILPASVDEAAEYFRSGLEQMDAIGSGDYEFTNELLLFAASVKGDELEDKDFHTLTNICELNISEDPEKFPWYAFAQGLSTVAGCKVLAKLSRWDDRSKVLFENTLSPYLLALLENGKMDADIALPLLRLCNPSESYGCRTSYFAQAIDNLKSPDKEKLIREFITQFEENNPNIPMDDDVKRLHSISSKLLGDTDEATIRLRAFSRKSKAIREQRNEHMNYRGTPDSKDNERVDKKDVENKKVVNKLIADTNPMDEIAISKAIDKLNAIQNFYTLESDYLSGIRANVCFGERSRYIHIISKLENLFYYRKVEELKSCKVNWGKSSKALNRTFSELGDVFLQLHSGELISHDRLSTSNLKEISELCDIPITTLALRLIKEFSSTDIYVPASVWMSLAAIICEKSDDGEGQKALVRLLNSSAAKLSMNVEDGEWEKNRYPSADIPDIAASLVWIKLGAPLAADRWRAAHSVRRFAKLGRWDVIDILVSKTFLDNAHPFQAHELEFYHLHARLWLLIALARVSIDYPKRVTKYADTFKKVALDKHFPHVLQQHFAASIIQICISKGNLKLSVQCKQDIEAVNHSPYPRLKDKARKFRINGVYDSRPDDAPEIQSEFSLDYDFKKYDVQYLSEVFGKYGWQMNDIIAKWARRFDDSIDGMYESGDRNRSFGRQQRGEITSNYHTYGQQLGWNALFLTAGELLAESPVTNDSFYDDPWPNWMSREMLTRKDGLWLYDGIDATPLDTKINLFEKGDKELVITGNQNTILSLIGLNSLKVKDNMIVAGGWHSSDGIRISISSALTPSEQTKILATKLSKEDPFQAWLPAYQEGDEEEEYIHNQKGSYKAWLVCPSIESKIDENDTLGAKCAMERPHFTKEITKMFVLNTIDPFKRRWKNSDGDIVAIAEAWGYTREHDEGTSSNGLRLKCSKSFLNSVLTQKNMDLMIFIKLERYEQSYGDTDSIYKHTTAVVTIKENSVVEFYEGHINRLHKSKF
ncbi:MAG: NACHT domain-containing protein [Colwellia sp.]|nr:NACHT domain-containing protein [Colwellia sp.]